MRFSSGAPAGLISRPASAISAEPNAPAESAAPSESSSSLGLGARYAHHLAVVRHAHDAHTLRIAPLRRDGRHRRTDHGAVVGDDEHVLALVHQHLAREQPGLIGQVHGLDALAAAALLAILIDERALAVAQLGNRQHLRAFLDGRHVHHFVAIVELDGLDPHRGAADGPHVVFRKADCHAHSGAQQHLAAAERQLDADQFVVLAQYDGDQPRLAQIGKLGKLGALDRTGPSGHHQVVPLLPTRGHGQHGGDLLAAIQLKQIHNRRAARGAPGLGDLVAIELVHAAAIGEEHQRVVRGSHEQLLDKILLARGRADDPLAAAPLGAVGSLGQAFDVPEVGQRDHHVLFLNEVDGVDLAIDQGDFGAAGIGVLAADLEDLGLHDVQHHGGVAQDVLEVGDFLEKLAVLDFDLVALQAGQPLESHVKDGLRLLVGQRKGVHQTLLGIGHGARRADQRDHLIRNCEFTTLHQRSSLSGSKTRPKTRAGKLPGKLKDGVAGRFYDSSHIFLNFRVHVYFSN